MPEIDTGDTAFMIIATALVLLMTPGLALFYGGMVRAKSVLNMMMMSFGALALISVLWVLYGYSIAFGTDQGNGLFGSPTEYFGLQGLMAEDSLSGTLPSMAFVAFQAVFAIITVALISGAIADRAKFSAWMVFDATAEPALNPNQPNHSRPAPSMTSVRLCGRMGSLPKPIRLPSTSASARPAAPALMCTAVPPAKSRALRSLAIQPPALSAPAVAPSKAKTQWATGK